MKTPDEIKKGLLICSGGFGDCAECPYHQTPAACMKLSEDALEYIQQLENQISELNENVAQLEAAQPKWISVEERSPEFPCICYDGVNPPHDVKQVFCISSMECTWYYDYDPIEFIETLYQTSDLDEPIDIGSMTHILFWMPLPELPKEDQA